MIAARVLDQRALNRALLARQLLLEPRGGALAGALERIGGIQAQYAPSMYVGAWSRIQGLERETVTRALERRRVVQGTLLRATIHLVSPRDWWPWTIATREERRKRWLSYHKGDPSAREMAAAARRVAGRLEAGPVTRAELLELVGKGPQGVTGINLWLDLVRIPPSGTWDRRRADLFADARRWIGSPPELTGPEARAELVRSYLRGFGPATPGEIADWAGLGAGQVSQALGRLELRRFRSEDGAELLDLPRQPLPDPATPAPPRFLPTWDAALLAHTRRTQILRERYRSRVFSTRTPQSVPTFLVDGQVAGSWREEDGRIRLQPFGRLAEADRRALEAEADRLAAFCA